MKTKIFDTNMVQRQMERDPISLCTTHYEKKVLVLASSWERMKTPHFKVNET